MRWWVAETCHFFNDNDKSIHNCIGVTITEKLDFEGLKSIFMKRGIMNFTKLRSVAVYKYGFWFWKQIDPEIAWKSCIRFVNSDINNEEDINLFVTKLMHSSISSDKPLWDIHVKEDYLEGKSVVFTRIHHTIGDGMSFF